ncbi:uncharacterized protein Dsimw501_GD28730 [Drosophila simulans]|uniref:Uncharacterized protein n=1 Tax=Drosophila simulans TaxID=7240 RepID=A0A0J9S1J7_DROSI|nr:uncharacterized protein Dsimw501_GD28730 [Drosophila simulans]
MHMYLARSEDCLTYWTVCSQSARVYKAFICWAKRWRSHRHACTESHPIAHVERISGYAEPGCRARKAGNGRWSPDWVPAGGRL